MDTESEIRILLRDLAKVVRGKVRIEKKINHFEEQEKEKLDSIRKLVEQLNRLKKEQALTIPIDSKLLELRTRLLDVIEELKDQNITVARQRQLFEYKQQLIRQLQYCCNHPFVLHRRGYEGSRSYDYDDGYPARRMCLVCGLIERESNKRFTKLGDDLQFYPTYRISFDQFYHPLEQIGEYNFAEITAFFLEVDPKKRLVLNSVGDDLKCILPKIEDFERSFNY